MRLSRLFARTALMALVLGAAMAGGYVLAPAAAGPSEVV